MTETLMLNLLSVGISLVALVVAVSGVYLTFLARGRLRIPPPKWMQIRQPSPASATQFCIPIVIVNTGARENMVVDLRCTIEFLHSPTPVTLQWIGTAPLKSFVSEPPTEPIVEGPMPMLLQGKCQVTGVFVFSSGALCGSNEDLRATAIELELELSNGRMKRVELSRNPEGWVLPSSLGRMDSRDRPSARATTLYLNA